MSNCIDRSAGRPSVLPVLTTETPYDSTNTKPKR